MIFSFNDGFAIGARFNTLFVFSGMGGGGVGAPPGGGGGTAVVFPMGLAVGLWGLRARRIAAILGGGGR